MPTIKQKAVARDLSENIGKPLGRAMRDAGYSKSTSETPELLTDSKGWAELMDEFIPDSLLQRKLQEGLDSNKQLAARVIFKKQAPTSQSAGELPLANSTTDDFIEVPDMPTRHKYLETAFKLKGKFPNEKLTLSGDADEPLIIQFIDERPENTQKPDA